MLLAVFLLTIGSTAAPRRGKRPPPCAGVACPLAEFASPFWSDSDALAKLNALLASSRDQVLSVRDSGNHSALNMAAYRGSVDCVRKLIQAGADPNNPDVNAHRPLHHAVLGCKASASRQSVATDIARLLLAAGGRADARAKDGASALTYATRQGLSDLASVLKASVSA
jgi:ankyrin repeat protein